MIFVSKHTHTNNKRKIYKTEKVRKERLLGEGGEKGRGSLAMSI